jgi:ketosteroid isomerase-like protein
LTIKSAVSLVVMLAGLLAGCSSFAVTAAEKLTTAESRESVELAAFKRAIRAKYDLKEQAYARGDAETVVSKFYAEDEITVGRNRVFLGRKEIRPAYQEAVREANVKVESVYTFVKGDAGWDWADFHITPKDGNGEPKTLAILFLWAKVNGDWICMGDFSVPGSIRSGKIGAQVAPTSK